MSDAPPMFPSRLALLAVSFLTILITCSVYVTDWSLLAPLLLGNGVIVVGWLLGAGGIGSLLLRALRVRMNGLLGWTTCIALGLGTMSLVVLLLGLAGWLGRISSIGLLMIGIVRIVVLLRSVNALPWGSFRTGAGWSWLLIGLMPLMGIALVCALLPPGLLWSDEPNGYDVVSYHLQVPREWFEARRIVGLEHNVFSFFPFNVEMHYLLAMHLMGGPWSGMYLAQLMHVSFMALTVVAIVALIGEQNRLGAIIAGVIVGATPWMSLLAPIAYNEGGLLLFGTLAIGMTIRALRDPHPARWMLLGGVFAGFAAGSKLTGAAVLLLPLPVLFYMIRAQWRTAWKSTAAFWLAGAIVLAPWLIRNAIWVGNPVFPEATSIFGKAHWSDTQVDRWKRAHQAREDQQNLSARLSALWQQILGDRRYALALFPLAIAAFVFRRDRQAITLVSLLGIQLAFWLFFTHLQSRFFILAIPICALLIGEVQHSLFRLVSALVAVAMSVGTIIFVCAKLNEYPSVIFTFMGIEQLSPLAGQPEVGDATLELVGDAKAFWYDVPMARLRYRTIFDLDAQSGDSIEQAWRKGWPPDGRGVIVLRNDAELERFADHYWAVPR